MITLLKPTALYHRHLHYPYRKPHVNKDDCHHHHQQWGLDPSLSSLRSHTHLTHRPVRSLTNPSHLDRLTSTTGSGIYSVNTPPLSILFTQFQSQHEPVRSNASL
uniref:Uncharacterized protein n=1 Tax=Schistocephalus solidus TaxID=70667 RepID=A0A0X3Q5J4_SCHSO